MKLRALIAGVALAASLMSQAARAEFPEKPIEMILPWPALATSTDIIARKVAEQMDPILGQTIKVVNKPGGAAVVGTAEMANARPDGYTIGGLTIGPAVSQVAAGTTPYSIDDLEPIGMFATLPFLIAARGDAPFNDIKSLAEWSKSTGKQPILAHWGKATVPTLSTYRIAEKAGFTFNEVSYTKVDASQLLNGEADVAIVPVTSVIGGIKDGSLKGIVALTSGRMSALPDLQTVREQGMDFDVAIWTGLFAPKGTPREVIDKLYSAMSKAVESKEVQDFSVESGILVYSLGPDETKAQMTSEYEAFRAVMGPLGLIKQ
ncbi:tripartite tricarboxylate transporter substrate binding protein [Shinella sp.]|uniref:tripartite tricarboxylate transporter substrate binding protein n=1 Tax=Shinella sp. TaxID=1870904 RepID=UPI00258ABAD1|nr:tripartite tricarboxylate transporter substrate binding protein [Shinella sp.]MCW5710708.1 tripartite tricarboxylate transporter substrate binding protein [Shinella sp.]